MAVKEQRPAVKRMKKGSSFFGYTDTSWNAAGAMRAVRKTEPDKDRASEDKQERLFEEIKDLNGEMMNNYTSN